MMRIMLLASDRLDMSSIVLKEGIHQSCDKLLMIFSNLSPLPEVLEIMMHCFELLFPPVGQPMIIKTFSFLPVQKLHNVLFNYMDLGGNRYLL